MLDILRGKVSRWPLLFLVIFVSHLFYVIALGGFQKRDTVLWALMDGAGIFLCLWMLQLYKRLMDLMKRSHRRETLSSRILKEKANLRRQTREENQRIKMLVQEIQDLKNQLERLHLAREVHRLRSDLRDGMNATLRNHAWQLSQHLVADEVILFLIDPDQNRRLFPKAHVRAGKLLKSKDLDISLEWLLQTRAPEAVEYGQVMMRSYVDSSKSRQGAFFSIPIAHDGIALGALTVVANPERSEEITQALQEIAGSLGLRIHNHMMYEKAITDGLTRLYVHAYFEDRLNELFQLYREKKSVFSLIMMDIDHFKKFNDTHGHQTGDEVLKQVAQLAQRAAGDRGIAFRYGGEEMTFLLPGVDGEAAFQFADTFRKVIESYVFKGAEGTDLKVTLSLGVASTTPDLVDSAELVSRADKALYESKEGGRNQTRRYGATRFLNPDRVHG